MKFHCIIETANENCLKRSDLLKKACTEQGIEFVELCADQIDHLNQQKIEPHDIIFKASPGKHAGDLERSLIRKDSTTFYKDNLFGLYTRSSSYTFHSKTDLPVIPTIPTLPKNRAQAKSYSEFLGGFPIIIKIEGYSKGIGVMKVDSLNSLVSVAGFLTANGFKGSTRKFIPHTKQARLIVIGDEVVSSHQKIATEDFRTNATIDGERKRELVTFSNEVNQIAIQATHTAGVEFGGVDILFDKETNEPYLSEMNFPCFFAMSQKITGVDIAGKMVAYLINKSRQHKT